MVLALFCPVVIDLLVDDLLHILMKLKGNLDDIEDVVFDDKHAAPKEIALLRREITTLRQIVIPLKRIVLDFSKEIQKFSEGGLTLYFDDVKDHALCFMISCLVQKTNRQYK
jgi:magnesium transporter